MIRRWLREPLFHFLVLGGLLFAASEWRGGAGSSRIVVTPGQVDSMAAAFRRTWQRPPGEQELKGLVDDYVREEIAAREAVAAGLDRDDTVIRRRLRQKLEYLVEDGADAAPVTEPELQAWLDRHPEKFRVEAETAFRQVYVSEDRRGASAEHDARVLLAKLTVTGSDAPDHVGDPSLLPRDMERSTRSGIARQFGEAFAGAVIGIEPGRWAGPIRSAYGLHLVWVHAREAERLPALEEVRPILEREVLADRRQRQMEAMYEQLLGRYQVVVERRGAASNAASADATP